MFVLRFSYKTIVVGGVVQKIPVTTEVSQCHMVSINFVQRHTLCHKMSYNATCNQCHKDICHMMSVSHNVIHCQRMSNPCVTMSNLVMQCHTVTEVIVIILKRQIWLDFIKLEGKNFSHFCNGNFSPEAHCTCEINI